MSKHTPGPWTIEGKTNAGGFQVSKPNRKDGTAFSTYWIASVGPSLDEDQANAKLIAAAPDLLHAVRSLLEGLKPDAPGEFSFQGVAYLERVAIPRAIAAIKKAEAA